MKKKNELLFSIKIWKVFLIERFGYKADIERAFVLGKFLGTEFSHSFIPPTAHNKYEFSISGIATELRSKSSSIDAIAPSMLEKKCLVASENQLLPSYLITAIANTLESD